ncbi:adenine phosphoribosyltransferase-like [Pelobates cultripes]|uniref:adenine phosphoribosyltransferase n=1 Tax=Pelobates cultripes TaxID=61616 RepID=A0AAD1VLU1_PELCU|nr:adenine phosphoribosyltransferase-like [Pelobates cultripes]
MSFIKPLPGPAQEYFDPVRVIVKAHSHPVTILYLPILAKVDRIRFGSPYTAENQQDYAQGNRYFICAISKFRMPGSCVSVKLDQDGSPEKRSKGWYLALMAPNENGPNYAWLDPSRLYCHCQALEECIKDLLQPFRNDTVDLVAGIDAMGFILGAAIASYLGKGFLAIRKIGHLCVKTKTQSYVDYSGREKVMEVRTDAIIPV